MHCQLCEPSTKQEQKESNLHQRFWRPPCCRLHHAPVTAQTQVSGREPRTGQTPCCVDAERRNRTSSDRSGLLIYSQAQCHSASSAFRESCLYSVIKKQKERVLPALNAQERPAPFVSYRTGLEISGAGVRSRWINAAVVNNRRTDVRPISRRLCYSRNSAY